MKKKLLGLTLLIFIFSAGMVTAATSQWRGMDIVKIFNSGKELKATDTPAVIIQGRSYVPLYMLRDAGLTVTYDASSKSVTVELPKAPKPIQKLTEAQLNELSKSVYKITAPKNATTMNQGSGFIVDGVMVTNYHIAGASSYAQVTVDGMGQKVGEYEFANESLDLMGFSVVGGKSLPISTELPEVGDPVYAIGYPHGELKISEGVVRVIRHFADGDIIIHTADGDHGSSGSPIFNGEGKVIGINSNGAISDGLNYNSAIPVKYLVDEMK